MVVEIKKKESRIQGVVTLDGSKSISNRVLAIQALCKTSFPITHLSSSTDTATFRALLKNNSKVFDAGEGGTTFRFFTALLAMRPGVQILTGSDRMKERPIHPLVNTLNQLGASIEYTEREGFPPLKIGDPDFSASGKREISIEAGLSSQFVSALLMIAPLLPQGLALHLSDEAVSKAYIKMTLGIMSHFGVQAHWTGNTIFVSPQEYRPHAVKIEADWSAASYYFGLAALSSGADLQLNGLMKNSLQGDAVLVEIMRQFGVESTFDRQSLGLKKTKIMLPEKLEIDCTDCPDLVQTFSVVCAGLRVPATFSGVQTLKIKETDRLAALENELGKTGVAAKHIKKDGRDLFFQSGKALLTDDLIFETYGDHRMALALAQLSVLHPVRIKHPEVVKKSYPLFWTDLEKLGFEIKYSG